MRPMLRVKNNNILLTRQVMDDLNNERLTWDDLFTDCKMGDSILEYIDPEDRTCLHNPVEWEIVHPGNVSPDIIAAYNIIEDSDSDLEDFHDNLD